MLEVAGDLRRAPAKFENYYYYSNSNSNSNNLFIPRKFNVRFQMRLTILNPLQFSNQIYNSLQFFHQIKCWFLRRGENRSTRRKTSRSRVENQQTQPTYDAESGNRTRDTLVEGERSHHCANPAPPKEKAYRKRKKAYSHHTM